MGYFTAPGLPRYDAEKKPFLFSISPETIQVVVCDFVSDYLKTPVTVASMRTKSRKRERVYARQLSFYYTRRECVMTLKEIGLSCAPPGEDCFDHCTVKHGLKTVKNLIETEPGYKDLVERISAEINRRIAAENIVQKSLRGFEIFEPKKKNDGATEN